MPEAFSKSFAPLGELQLHALQEPFNFLRTVKAQMNDVAQVMAEARMERNDEWQNVLKAFRHERKREAVDVEVEVDGVEPGGAGFESVHLIVMNDCQ